jgi:hypothetical protein
MTVGRCPSAASRPDRGGLAGLEAGRDLRRPELAAIPARPRRPAAGGSLGVPVAWHLKEAAAPRPGARGTGRCSPSCGERADARISPRASSATCSRRGFPAADPEATPRPGRRPAGRPMASGPARPAPARLSAGDGEVHTVLCGRPYGMDPAWVAELSGPAGTCTSTAPAARGPAPGRRRARARAPARRAPGLGARPVGLRRGLAASPRLRQRGRGPDGHVGRLQPAGPRPDLPRRRRAAPGRRQPRPPDRRGRARRPTGAGVLHDGPADAVAGWRRARGRPRASGRGRCARS